MEIVSNKSKTHTAKIIGAVLVIVILIGAIGLLAFYYTETKNELATKIASSDAAIAKMESNINTLSERNTELQGKLLAAQTTNAHLGNQLGEITDKVGTLTKLTQTDPELLKKYSKVFFLSENYTPKSLSDVEPRFIYNESKVVQLDTKVMPFLRNMFEDAQSDDIYMKVASGYRSFGTQAGLKSQYKVTYGAGTANQFSAEQGYSEHQLGSTVDLTTISLKGAIDGFDQTDAFAWMQKNAYRYGFVLSYPKGNTYYEYEPWHWRFVGIDLSRKLHSDKENYYDLDQRVIDTYLVGLFDRS